MYEFFRNLQNGDFESEEKIMSTASFLDSIYLLTIWGSIVISIVTAILFLVWTFRSAKNAQLLSSLPMRMAPGWTVGWYFVPFANFWMPFRGMREIWLRSTWPPKKRAPVVLNLWWITWIAASVLNNLAVGANNSDDIRVAASFSLIGGLTEALWIIPSVCLIWIVHRVHTMQVEKRTDNPNGPPDGMLAFEQEAIRPVSAV